MAVKDPPYTIHDDYNAFMWIASREVTDGQDLGGVYVGENPTPFDVERVVFLTFLVGVDVPDEGDEGGGVAPFDCPPPEIVASPESCVPADAAASPESCLPPRVDPCGDVLASWDDGVTMWDDGLTTWEA